MRFFSDNAAMVCPDVMQAMIQANHVDRAYDGDALSQALDAAFSERFETDVAVIWLTTGTAANALALSLLCPPFGAVLAHEEAHVLTDECGAVEFFAHGARLIGCPGEGAKLSPAGLAARMSRIRADVHQTQPHAVTITNASEYGLSYRPDEVQAIGAFCRNRGLRLHMDGARLANAVAYCGCSLADMSWRAGVDALSFGFTKNGAMAAEALILFDPQLAAEARIRRKRAGHLHSKGRFIAAQLHAMLKNDLWLTNAQRANAAAQLISEAAPERLLHQVEANEVFMHMAPQEVDLLRAKGFDFYGWGADAVRLVTSWHHHVQDVMPLADAIRAL